MLADQFVVGEPALHVLGNHVDILKVTLDEVAVKGRCRATKTVDILDDLGSQPYRMGCRQAQYHAPLQAQRSRRRELAPEFAYCLLEKGAPGTEGGFGLPDSELADRLLAQQPLHVTWCLRAGELGERVQAAPREAERYGRIAARESQRERNLVSHTAAHLRCTLGKDRALSRHEDVLDLEMVSPGASHAARAPRVQ